MLTLADLDEIAEFGEWPVGMPWDIFGDFLATEPLLVDKRPVEERHYSNEEWNEPIIGTNGLRARCIRRNNRVTYLKKGSLHLYSFKRRISR